LLLFGDGIPYLKALVKDIARQHQLINLKNEIPLDDIEDIYIYKHLGSISRTDA
jgi:hypothetical protein